MTVTRGTLALRVFFGYQIDSKHHRTRDIRRLGKTLQDLMKAKVSIVPEYGEFPPGTQLWSEVLTAIGRSDVVVMDISENNPNVLLEAGLGYGLQKLVVLMRARTADVRLPSDLGAFLHVPYSGFDCARLARAIRRGIDAYLKGPKDPNFYFRHLWSLRSDSRTYVLPGKLPEDYGKNPLEDYLRLRNFTDLDAVLLVTETLTRLYPSMTVLIHQAKTTNELPQDWHEANIVCIGGPDYNPIVRQFDRRCPLEYCYDNDAVWLRDKATGRKFVPKFTADGGLRRAEDYGFFLKGRVSNNSPGRLVVIGGARSWGVYGATMLVGCKGFLGESAGAQNVKRIVLRLGTDPSFVVRVKVRGSTEGVESPDFHMRDLVPLVEHH